MNQSSSLEQLLEIIKNDEDSVLYQFLNSNPTNDYQYLQFWFDFLELRYVNQDFVQDLIKQGRKEQFLLSYNVFSEVKTLLEKTKTEKLSNLNFSPRLEVYLEKFSDYERDNVRLLILSYLYQLSRGDLVQDNLTELANQFHIPHSFIFSLDREHPLFADFVLEVEEDSVFGDKSFYFRDLIINHTIYAIFAGLDVPEEDLLSLQESPLIDLFGLVVTRTSDPQALTKGLEEVDEPDIGGEKEFESLEDLIRETKDEELNLPKSVEEDSLEFDSGELEPYKDNLEYFLDEYVWISLLKEKMEVWNDRITRDDRENEKRSYALKHAIQQQRNKCEIRLKKSMNIGFVPRVEKIADRLHLNQFEKDILKVLTAEKIFLDAKQDKYAATSYDVGELLTLLIDDRREQVKLKRVFLKTANLVKYNLIHLSEMDRINQDLYNFTVQIDNRLVEYFLGEKYDISDYLEGSFLYRSQVPIDNVILPDSVKKKVLDTIKNFPTFLEAKKDLKFSEIVEYGNSLVMLFVGTSGTGKTMFANALSNQLNKKILLFNLNNLSQLESVSQETQLFSMLFREARMNDAILFFDESEVLLQHRFGDLLIEIEKHEGIVIFATNANFKIDEGMRRRINLVVKFPEPGPALRKNIWQVHLPKSLSIDDSVDLNKIAQRFELNGGLIKNAIFSALSFAVNESSNGKLILKEKHLEDGAKEQLHNKLFMSKLEDQKIPEKGLDSLILPQKTIDTLGEIIEIEKAQKVLEGEWGFGEVFSNSKGVAILLYGPPGTGKTHTAEAIAYETGKNLKIVNFAQVFSMWVGGTEKALETLFKEVAGGNSILLFNEAEALFGSRTEIFTSSDRYANLHTDYLLDMIERYNTFAILTSNNIDNIDQAFYRRMQYLIELKDPDQNLRRRLWEKLIPPKMPIANDFDPDILAQKYEFNGGDIKNVIFRAATKRAISTSNHKAVSMQDFLQVCEELKVTKNGDQKHFGF